VTPDVRELTSEERGATAEQLWAELEPIGQDAGTGGYRRFAWTATDAELREWFAARAADLGLDVTHDRAGNQWAWWGDPDAAVAAGSSGIAIGSHLDSVPDGGAYDGPLGVVAALATLSALKRAGLNPSRPIGVVNFGDEEGARFGIACAGSRLVTGALAAEGALALRDADGISMGEAIHAAGRSTSQIGIDRETLCRIGAFVELHVEQGRLLANLRRPVAVAESIWPHGRWRFELEGIANHAGTTRLDDRDDPMLRYAELVLRARSLAERYQILGTCGKIRVEPNGVNAIPSRIIGWLDARGEDAEAVKAMVTDFESDVVASRGSLEQESWTDKTVLDSSFAARLSGLLGDAPLVSTGAGHDAGILAQAGIPSAMLFVRNPTGVSHSPAEHAEWSDCIAGIEALTTVVRKLAEDHDAPVRTQ
jgi:beta-ureidopropionase / N-carbamoyl-L-amino-acid hydrolase